MKVIGNICKGLLVLLLLITGSVAVCIANPDLTAKIAAVVNPVETKEKEIPATNFASREVFPGDENYLMNPVQVADAALNGDEQAAEAIRTANTVSGASGRAGLGNPESDYVAPSTSNVRVPSDVSGKNGYEGVKADDEEIGDSEADALWKELGPGETGSDLSFDATFYPFFQMLDDEGKNTYRQIFANANAGRKAFTPVEQNLSSAELKTAFEAVVNDHPELFWMDTGYSAMFRNSGNCVEINLKFNRTADDLANAKAEFELNSQQIVSGAAGLGSNYEKEKHVHDALIERVNYSTGAEMNQSAYSALVNDSTVCAGYARAFQYCMQQLGIPTYYCTGYAGESHAWNIVSLDDGFYNADTTWDDTGDSKYAYFNKTDSDYGTTHVRQDLSVYLPPCEGTAYRNLEEPLETADASEGNTDASADQSAEAARSLEEAVAAAAASRAQEHAEQAAEAEAVATPAAMKAREEEAAAEEEAARMFSLEDYGISQDDVLNSISEYYTDCKKQIESRGTGSYSFYNVISGESVMQELYTAYRQKATQRGFLNDAVANVGGSECSISVEPEQLTGGQYLLRHTISIK